MSYRSPVVLRVRVRRGVRPAIPLEEVSEHRTAYTAQSPRDGAEDKDHVPRTFKTQKEATDWAKRRATTPSSPDRAREQQDEGGSLAFGVTSRSAGSLTRPPTGRAVAISARRWYHTNIRSMSAPLEENVD